MGRETMIFIGILMICVSVLLVLGYIVLVKASEHYKGKDED